MLCNGKRARVTCSGEEDGSFIGRPLGCAIHGRGNRGVVVGACRDCDTSFASCPKTGPSGGACADRNIAAQPAPRRGERHWWWPGPSRPRPARTRTTLRSVRQAGSNSASFCLLGERTVLDDDRPLVFDLVRVPRRRREFIITGRRRMARARSESPGGCQAAARPASLLIFARASRIGVGSGERPAPAEALNRDPDGNQCCERPFRLPSQRSIRLSARPPSPPFGRRQPV